MCCDVLVNGKKFLNARRTILRDFNSFPPHSRSHAEPKGSIPADQDELQFTNTLGGDFDMIDYDTVSPAIKKAFDEYDWGSANCPFNQAHFLGNLAEAWI